MFSIVVIIYLDISTLRIVYIISVKSCRKRLFQKRLRKQEKKYDEKMQEELEAQRRRKKAKEERRKLRWQP